MNKKILTGALLVFIAGGLTGYLLFASFKDGTAGCVSEFTHINPEPDCEVFDERSGKLEALQSSLEAKVHELELQGDIDHVAVFTRDLTSRRFAGVNDDRVFVLASLLKVPIFIAYHKFAEVEPAVLTDEILYTGTPNSYDRQKEIPPSERLVVGQRYTVEELLSRMIIHSDNIASDILLPRMTESFMIKTLSSLGVQVEKNPGEKEALVTARTYANVFRGLYNASYLSREYSEKTLKLLTLTTFDRGTRGALPEGVEVAEKFGERTNVDEKGIVLSRQLHNCGIVYAKDGKTPYTFCIMTEGTEYEALETAVQALAKEIYKTLGE